MKIKGLLLLSPILSLGLCISDQASEESGAHVYWVNSLKVPCTGVGPMECLEIQRGAEMSPDEWELFYASIEGFEFEPGYIYKLKVIEDDLPPEEVAADASSKKYVLDELLEKNADETLPGDPFWKLERIYGTEISDQDTSRTPGIRFDLANLRVSGSDGCNNFTGPIEHMDRETLELGILASTKMACPDMTIPDQVLEALGQVRSYSIGDQNLYFYDTEGNELLLFGRAE